MSNLSELLPSGGGQNVVEFTADGAISSGAAVALTSAGKAKAIGSAANPATVPDGSVTDLTTSMNGGGGKFSYSQRIGKTALVSSQVDVVRKSKLLWWSR